jgi:hypothetical protein
VEGWDKSLVQMISMIHDETTMNTGGKDRETNLEIKKPYTIVQYNEFMKRVDTADQHLCYYSVLGKTVKLLRKVVSYLPNCALFNAFFVYRKLNVNIKVKYKSFLNFISPEQNQVKF